MNSYTKITEKDTLGQIDLVEKFVHRDVRKMNITDNIQFFRHLFLDQLNNQSSRSLSLYRLFLNSLHYILIFQQGNSNLMQSGFVVFAFYRRFLTGSLRMSEKCGTLKGFGFKKARPIDDKDLKKTLREKKKMLLTRNFPFFKYFPFYERKQIVF